MYDVIIVGAGPAGISAGLYAKKAGANTLILYSGQSNIEKATEINNYYGFENGIDGKELYINGIQQAKNIGIDVYEEEVLNIVNDNLFIVETTKNKYESKAVIIATGNKKIRPDIEGILEFEGRGISYCSICDGFFYKNKDVAVIGNSQFAIFEAENLKNIANKVTILTNGESIKSHCNFDVITTKIKTIKGNTKLESVEFTDGTSLDVDGIFIALGEASGCDFAKKLGLLLDNDNIKVDENMKTNINGLYACGNTTGGLLQICKAVYEGAKAGLSAANYINEEVGSSRKD